MAATAVSARGSDWEIACCRSVVNVAIPQRRGSELPINARRLNEFNSTSDERAEGQAVARRKGAAAKQDEVQNGCSAYRVYSSNELELALTRVRKRTDLNPPGRAH